MSRTDELKDIFNKIDSGKRVVVEKLVEEMIFIEEQIEQIKKLPFIKTKTVNGVTLQKQTAAARMYKEMLSQYKEITRYLCAVYSDQENGDGESQLSKFYKLAEDFIRGNKK